MGIAGAWLWHGGLWEPSEGCGGVQEGWPRAGSPGVVISSSAPRALWGSALKEMQGRISTEKAELSLPRADEKRYYKVTGLW